jgi:hypothetical protein
MPPKKSTSQAAVAKPSSSSSKRKRKSTSEGEGDEDAPGGGIRQVSNSELVHMYVANHTAKKTANRTTEKTAKIYHPGERNNASSFVLFHSIEAFCASYNGYDDVRDLRRFVVSIEFLQCFHHFNKDWSMNMSAKKALGIIRDDFIDGEEAEDFPLAVEDLKLHAMGDLKKEKYTKNEEQQRHRYLAHILIVMKHLWSGPADEEVEDLDDDNNVRGALEKKHGHIDAVPIVSNDRVIRPQLFRSGFQEDESDLEPYNRAWNLLRYFKYVTASTAHWKSKFGDVNTWDRSTAITAQNVPDWMRNASSAPLASNPLAQAYAKLPLRNFKLIWKRGGKGEDEKSLEAYLQENEDELELPNPKIDADGDPRIHDQYEFRDSIRLQYKCLSNRLQISKLTMRISPGNSDEDDQQPQDWDIDTCEWEELTTALETSSDEVEVIVRLRPLDDDEENVMESSAPPAQLKGSFLGLRPGDKNIRSANPHRKGEAVVSEDDFLRAAGGRTSRPKSYKPDPTKHFDLSTDRAAYLKHFDGIDVASSEKERNKWLEKTLKQVLPAFGQKPRPKSKKKNNVMSKKQGKQTEKSADMVEKLERACREGELAAIHGAVSLAWDLASELVHS